MGNANYECEVCHTAGCFQLGPRHLTIERLVLPCKRCDRATYHNRLVVMTKSPEPINWGIVKDADGIRKHGECPTGYEMLYEGDSIRGTDLMYEETIKAWVLIGGRNDRIAGGVYVKEYPAIIRLKKE